MKHHYVPQFLLRRWTNASGKLQVFAVRHGQLVRSELTPKHTGYERGLYGILAGVFGLAEEHIEKRLFGPLDNNAAKVLEKFEAHEAINEDDHIAWTFFLSSLRIRQPDTLTFVRTEGMKHLKQRSPSRTGERCRPERLRPKNGSTLISQAVWKPPA